MSRRKARGVVGRIFKLLYIGIGLLALIGVLGLFGGFNEDVRQSGMMGFAISEALRAHAWKFFIPAGLIAVVVVALVRRHGDDNLSARPQGAYQQTDGDVPDARGKRRQATQAQQSAQSGGINWTPIIGLAIVVALMIYLFGLPT